MTGKNLKKANILANRKLGFKKKKGLSKVGNKYQGL